MSQLPDPQGVARLRSLVSQHRALETELRELDALVAAKKKRQEEAGYEYRDLGNAIVGQLDSMDCRANANNGWAHRIIWMLAELEEQSRNASAPAEGE